MIELTEEIARAAGVTYEMAMRFADEGSPDYVQALLHAVETNKRKDAADETPEDERVEG